MDTVGILNCNEDRPFWITFEDGHIKLGRGHEIGLDLVLDFIDSAAEPYDVTSYNLVGKDPQTTRFKIYKSSGVHA